MSVEVAIAIKEVTTVVTEVKEPVATTVEIK
jgi:hypothetical protein